jgi:cell division protein FtsA
MQDSLFAGIDIGSSAIRIAVGQRVASRGKEQVHVISAAEVPSEGITRGTINSLEDAVSCISSCLEKAERMTGTPVSSAWVSLSGAHATVAESKGVVAVSRPDGEIREEDVQRAVEAAQTVMTPVNHEIIHVIPKAFLVDGQAGVKDPVGMNGIRLEVDARIIQANAAHVKNLTKCIYRTGINIERLVLGILASSEVVTTSRQRELGVVVVNMGGSTTTMAVFEQGDILHIASIPLGADHITADVAIGLRTSIEIAERIKCGFASTLPSSFSKKDEISLRDVGAESDELVSLHYVAQIVQARVDEILDRVDRELKKIGRSGLLPAGVIFTGGGSKLNGLVEFAKQKLRLPVSLGYPMNITSITDRVNDLAFSTAIGLVQWGINEHPDGTHAQLEMAGAGLLGKVTPQMDAMKKRIQQWFGG